MFLTANRHEKSLPLPVADAGRRLLGRNTKQCERQTKQGDATEMYDRLVERLKDRQGITEQLKADDMMTWVQAMNNIANQAREIVNSEVIYTL